MKNIFSKLMAMLLMAALFLPVACADYDEDIKNVQERLEALEEGEIDPAGVDVKELANQLTQVSGKLDQAIADHEADKAALEAAIKAGDEALSDEVADVVADLSALETLMNGKLAEAVEALEKADEDLAAAMKAGDEELALELAAEVVEREQAIAAMEETIAGLVEEVQGEFDHVAERIDAVNEVIAGMKSVDEELKADIAENAAKIAEAEGTIKSLTEFASQAMAAIQNHEQAIATMSEELEALRGKLAAHELDYQQFYQQATAAIQNHETSITTLTEELEGVLGRVEKLEGTVASLTEFAAQAMATLTNHEMAIQTLSDYKAQLEEEIIPAMKEQITSNAGLIEMAIERLDLLEQSFTMLNNLVQDHAEEFAAYKEALAEELEENFGEIGEALVALGDANIRQDKLISENQNLIAALQEQVALNTEAIMNLRAELLKEAALRAELQLNFEEFYQYVNMVMANHETGINTLKDQLEALTQLHEDDMITLQEFAARVEEVITNHEGAITTMSDELAVLRAQYDAHIIDYKTFVQNVTVALQNHEGSINTLSEELDALKAMYEADMLSLKEFAARVEEVITNHEGAITTMSEELDILRAQYDAHIIDYKTFVQNVTITLQNHEGSINTLSEELDAHKAAYEAHMIDYQTYVQNVDFALTNINTTLNVLRGDIDGLEEAYNKHVAEYEEFAEAMKTYVQEVNQIAQQNAQNITRIEETIEDMKSEFAAHEKAYEEFYMEYTEALVNLWGAIEATQADVDGLSEKVANLEAFESTAQGWMVSTDFRLESLDIAVEDLQNELAALRGEYEAFEEAYGKFYQNVNVAIKAITDTNMEQDRVLKIAQDDIALLNQDLKAAQERLSTLETAFGEFANNFQQWGAGVNDRFENIEGEMGDIKDDIADIQGNVADLLSRVQSIVYVPEYVDGKATVEWVTLDGTILGSTVTMTYQVYPEEAAAAIAYAVGAADADTESPLSYQFECLKTTRAAHGESAEIVEVGAMEGGRLVVKAALKGLQDAFFLGLSNDAVEGYAMSLVLNTEDGTNCSSCFTQLAPASTATEAVVKIYRNGKDVTNKNVGTISIPYTDSDYIWYPIKDHYFVFEVGENNYTADQLAAAGYNVPKFEYKSGLVANINFMTWFGVFDSRYAVVDAAGAGYGELTLPANLDKLIGSIVTVTYTYNNGLTVAESLEITKETSKLDLGVAQFTWNYDMDAPIDADLLEGKTSFYSRDAVSLNPIMAGDELPAGTTIADVLSGELKSVLINGEVNEDIMVNFNADETIAYMAISGFEWDEEYEIKALFELDNVLVEAYLNLTTVDRSRELIQVLHTSEVTLYNDIVFEAWSEENPVKNIDLVEAYEQISYDLGTFNSASAWVTDNFGRLYDITSNTVAAYATLAEGNEDVAPVVKNIGTGWTTNHQIGASEKSVEASIGFSYATFDFIPEAVRYTMNITTWYGQEIELVQDVVFVLPTLYDFKHTVYVYGNKTEGYYSEVQPYYVPDLPTTALEIFDVQAVNMNASFNLKNAEGEVFILDTENGTARDEENNLNFVAEFELEDAYENITIADNKISYYGEADYVDVYGALYVVFSNGARMAVGTSFDGGDYYNYIVKKFDPILMPKANYAVEVEVDNAREYEVSIYDLIELYDVREYALTEGDGFVVGNNRNGFAAGVNAADLYGLEVEWANNIDKIDVELRKYFTFANGILTFDNSAQVELTAPVEVKVLMTVKSAWNSYPMEVTAKFYPRVMYLD